MPSPPLSPLLLFFLAVAFAFVADATPTPTISPTRQQLTVDDLPECKYEANNYGQVCCMEGQNCNPLWCKCPSGWQCTQNICTATCTSFLLQTNSGKPWDSFTYCDTKSNRRGMPNCECPDSTEDGVESTCIPDFHFNYMPQKMCSYRKYFTPGKGNRGLGWKWRRRPQGR